MSKKRSRTAVQRSPKTVAFWSFMAVALVAAIGMYWVTATRTTDSDYVSTYQPDAAPAPTVTTVAFLGDSYTEGSGSSEGALRWTTRLSQAQGWHELNFGFRGTNYGTAGADPAGTPYTARVRSVVDARPNIVIVSGGSNDRDTDQSEGIATTFEELRAGLPEAQIIALSPFWKSEALPVNLTKIAGQVQRSVESVGGRYVDIHNPLQGHPEMLVADGVHPNDAGHQRIADTVQEILNKTGQ